MNEKYIEDIIYLKEKITGAKKDKVNIRNIQTLKRYFDFIVLESNDDKCYHSVLNGNVIVLNKKYSEEEKLIRFSILLGYSLIYLKDNPNTYDEVYYTKNVEIPLEYKKMYKSFAKDLLLETNDLDSLLEKRGKIK